VIAFTIEKTKKKNRILSRSQKKPSGRKGTGDSQPPKKRSEVSVHISTPPCTPRS
jgi:hypothetical protein